MGYQVRKRLTGVTGQFSLTTPVPPEHRVWDRFCSTRASVSETLMTHRTALTGPWELHGAQHFWEDADKDKVGGE